VGVFIVLDIITSGNVIDLFAEGFILFFVAYALQSYFDANAATVAFGVEAMSLLCWMLLSMFWNITIMKVPDTGLAYSGLLMGFMVSSVTAAFGALVGALFLVELAKIKDRMLYG
jgi:hypothetical protein